MPEWVAKAQCNKCKKTGHLAFNCPPKFNNQKRASPKSDRYHRFKNSQGKLNERSNETAAIAQTEFAGYTRASPDLTKRG